MIISIEKQTSHREMKRGSGGVAGGSGEISNRPLKKTTSARLLLRLAFQNREDAALLIAYHFLHNLQVQGTLEKEMQAQHTGHYGLDSLTRDLVVVICNMMFGAGKSRLGEELCKLFKKLKEMGPEGLAALGRPSYITNFVGEEGNLEMLSSMQQINVNFKNSPPKEDVSLQQALAISILQYNEEYCKFQEWIKEQNRPLDPAGPGDKCKNLSSSLPLQNRKVVIFTPRPSSKKKRRADVASGTVHQGCS